MVLSIFGNAGSLYNWAPDHKSIIVGGSIYRGIQKIGTFIYPLSCIVCFHVFYKSVFTLSATCVFKENKFVKMSSCCCKHKKKKKKKLVLCKNSVISKLLRSWYILYWDDELTISLVWMWLTPQLYRQWCFGFRFRGCRWWLVCLVWDAMIGVLHDSHMSQTRG
jgi:hypothetical protein